MWQPRTRAHIKEPRNALERQAADIDDAATTANLRGFNFRNQDNPVNSLGESRCGPLLEGRMRVDWLSCKVGQDGYPNLASDRR